MSRRRRPPGVTSGWEIRLRRLMQRLELRPGEVTELLDRLPLAAVSEAAAGASPPARREWRLVRCTVEAYAARRRAIARQARQGRL